MTAPGPGGKVACLSFMEPFSRFMLWVAVAAWALVAAAFLAGLTQAGAFLAGLTQAGAFLAGLIQSAQCT